MRLYDEQVLPRLSNILLGSKEFGEKIRARACAGLHGDVLEIGFGSGLNVAYYPPEVREVWAVEPSEVALRLAARRMERSPVPIHPAGLTGERLDFPDDRFDAALSTMTLCTIPDVAAALAEVRRVLKPGSALHFAEHGHAPDPKVQRTQQRFEPWQRRLAGGCHLTRDIPMLLRAAGFELEDVVQRYVKGPKAWSYMYIGRARKP